MKRNKYCPNDGTGLRYYDGALGYEAVYCPRCGYFADHKDSGQDDSFINKPGPSLSHI